MTKETDPIRKRDTKIGPCSCVHGYQDEKYGRGMRVLNRCGKDGLSWRCTVCSRESR
jgi:hypothetical protein